MDDDAVGSVQVKVSPAAIHKAVRNILVNEMGLSREAVQAEIRGLVKEVAEVKIGEFTLSHLKDNGWDGARLHDRVRSAMQKQIDDLKPIVKDVARELVHETISKDVEGVVEGIIAGGLKVRLGWSRDALVKVEAAPHARRTWVPIGDRMPSDGKPILVCHGNPWSDGKDVGPAIFADGEFRTPGGATLTKVTHWRRLPEPPARDED